MVKHQFFATAIFATLLIAPAYAAPRYHLTDLGDLPGGTNESNANAINNSGQVIGVSRAATGSRAFLWTNSGGMQDLGDLPGGADSSAAFEVNDAGQVVGSSFAATGSRGFVWTSTGGMQDIGDLTGGADSSQGWGINAQGQIVGVSVGAAGSHAILYDNGNMQDLGVVPGHTNSTARSISDNGLVVGVYNSATGLRAFVWKQASGMQDLGDLPGGAGRTIAYRVGPLDRVVGESDVTGGDHAYLWTFTDGMLDLGVLPGYSSSVALDVNASGQIVGGSGITGSPSPGHAFLWSKETGLQDLSAMVDESGSGWKIYSANSINDAGLIVGDGFNPDGFRHAFLLTPIPEPATIALAMCGAGILTLVGVRRSRRSGTPVPDIVDRPESCQARSA